MSSLACCMIVRDAVATIEAAIGSVLPHVDHVFVLDTGSTDGTLEALRSLPVTVKQTEWPGDFAQARNMSFAMPDDRFTHLLWIDGDDTLVGGEHLRALAAPGGRYGDTVDGYVMTYHYGDGQQGREARWPALRMVRRAFGWQWRRPVHESLFPALPHSDPVVEEADEVWVVHHGPSGGHPQRDLELLLELTKQGDPRSLEDGNLLLQELLLNGHMPDELRAQLRQLSDEVLG